MLWIQNVLFLKCSPNQKFISIFPPERYRESRILQKIRNGPNFAIRKYKYIMTWIRMLNIIGWLSLRKEWWHDNEPCYRFLTMQLLTHFEYQHWAPFFCSSSLKMLSKFLWLHYFFVGAKFDVNVGLLVFILLFLWSHWIFVLVKVVFLLSWLFWKIFDVQIVNLTHNTFIKFIEYLQQQVLDTIF